MGFSNFSITNNDNYSIGKPHNLAFEKFQEECGINIDLDLECPICFDYPFKNPHLINICNHIFCKVCIDSLKEPICPFCKCEFTAQHVVFAEATQECINNLSKEILKKQQECINALRIPLEEQKITLAEKLKLGQIVELIFSGFAEDQSIPRIPTLKTTWSHETIERLNAIKVFWNSFYSNSDESMNSYLDALEKVAFELADIAKIQSHSLQMVVNSGRQELTVRNGGSVVHHESLIVKDGGKIIKSINGINIDIMSLFNQLKNISSRNASLNDQMMKIYIGNREVRRSDSDFIRAVIYLDELLITYFSNRFTREEFGKSFIALAKVSSESDEKQQDALISLCDYCNSLLQENNLNELLNHYNALSQEEEGIELLGKITENLISKDPSNKEKIQTIIASLDENSVNFLKYNIRATNRNINSIESSLKLLFLCQKHKDWYMRQVSRAIENCINAKKEEMAARLVDEYLMRYQATREEGIKYIRTIISRSIDINDIDNAKMFIDKCFLNNEATREEGMDCIRSIISKYIDVCQFYGAEMFIKKYFLKNEATREEGIQHIRALISKGISIYSFDCAERCIKKYFFKNKETFEEGMQYIRMIITTSLNTKFLGDQALMFIEKYLLKNKETREEGMKYIRILINNNENFGYGSEAKNLRIKYKINN